MTGYEIARKQLGLHEVRDKVKLQTILKASAIKGDIAINPATTAWCAAIMNAWERSAGNRGNGRLNARSFLTYGDVVYDRAKKIGKLADAKKGDIVIFERGGSTWQGHVAYLDGIEKARDGSTLIRTLGGNQSNAVTIGWYPASRLLGVRRPPIG